MQPTIFDKYIQLSALGDVARNTLRRGLPWVALFLAIVTGKIYHDGNAGWFGFALMSVATCISLSIWRSVGTGLPLLPLLAVQQLAVFGLPLVGNAEETQNFPAGYLTDTGVEVMLFILAASSAWYFVIHALRPSSPRAYCFNFVSLDRTSQWERIGPILLISVTIAQVVITLGYDHLIYALLPAGSASLGTSLIGAAAMSGFFLTAMRVGHESRSMGSVKALLWTCFVINFALTASGLLLSTVTNYIAALSIGLFWASGRMPWRFLIIMIGLLSFLNVGKVDMRTRYWSLNGELAEPIHIQELPVRYAEWTEISYDRMIGVDPDKIVNAPLFKNQSLFDRINNLQNLLFVMDGIKSQHLSPLNGATYTLIPPLLIPRIFWAAKPRAHEGQVLLNVHFGRQDLESTFSTYIAWGILAEAYGNFGPWFGSLVVGAFMGAAFAWVERYTSAKPLFSIEGLISLSFFIGVAASFEMVASVMVTSLFQSTVMIAMACAPFARRMTMLKPDKATFT